MSTATTNPHEVCELTVVDVVALRRWARATSFAADLATRAELVHALEHLEVARLEGDQGDSVDQRCHDTITTELLRREMTPEPSLTDLRDHHASELRREAIKRAASAMVRLSACPDHFTEARHFNRITTDDLLYNDTEAWEAVRILEDLVTATRCVIGAHP